MFADIDMKHDCINRNYNEAQMGPIGLYPSLKKKSVYPPHIEAGVLEHLIIHPGML